MKSHVSGNLTKKMIEEFLKKLKYECQHYQPRYEATQVVGGTAASTLPPRNIGRCLILHILHLDKSLENLSLTFLKFYLKFLIPGNILIGKTLTKK
jgi:hypothetical protein